MNFLKSQNGGHNGGFKAHFKKWRLDCIITAAMLTFFGHHWLRSNSDSPTFCLCFCGSCKFTVSCHFELTYSKSNWSWILKLTEPSPLWILWTYLWVNIGWDCQHLSSPLVPRSSRAKLSPLSLGVFTQKLNLHLWSKFHYVCWFLVSGEWEKQIPIHHSGFWRTCVSPDILLFWLCISGQQTQPAGHQKDG